MGVQRVEFDDGRTHLHQLAETGRVVVAYRLRVAERLEYGIRLQYPLLYAAN